MAVVVVILPPWRGLADTVEVVRLGIIDCGGELIGGSAWTGVNWCAGGAVEGPGGD